MNWQALFEIQKALDDRIVLEHGLHDRDLVPSKILALQVELGELANETRCFKYWSKKPASSRETILGEYVDVVHFVLSLCLTLGVRDVVETPEEPAGDLTAHFSYMMGLAHRLLVTRAQNDMQSLFAATLCLGDLLGFSEGEIEQAYLHKNNVNHQRQEQGY